MAFGFGINGNTSGGGSAFIDDDMFGARQNANTDATFATTDSGETLTQRPDANAGTYIGLGGCRAAIVVLQRR